MILYASAIFLGAFLLFQVQLIVARMILPWFGGTAAVWTTCMLFFQVVLLLGYVYADWSVRRLRPKTQVFLHVSLLVACLPLLPIVPGGGWKPSGAGDPTLRILLLLAATVGLPYLVLSTTSPLLQAWYARTYRGAIPYRLFALSNAGSLIALVSYPAAVEPFLAVRRQALGWSAGFLVFALLCAAAALRSRSGEGGEPADALPIPAKLPSRSQAILWTALAACASTLFLAVTNHLTQNVAPVPFLWVLPLALYLSSFILCFAADGRWYRRGPWFALLAAALGGAAYAHSGFRGTAPLALLIPAFAAALFAGCMVCHGELARMKPHAGQLTGYYLMIALGGASGGVFVGVLAPNLFSNYFELPLAVAATAVLVLVVLSRDSARAPRDRRRRRVGIAAGVACFLALAGYLGYALHEATRGWRWRVMARNFYGSVMVGDSGTPGGTDAVRTFVHGAITHGKQFLHPSLRRRPTAYYDPESGVGLAIRDRDGRGPQRVGVVGLGVGTLACYGRRGDSYRFYEINPLVIRLAGTEFSFLADSEAAVDVVPGDARLSMEREPARRFDLLAVDAFSGDSIPVHLLTREAFELYFRHLKGDGVLAVHVSNKYLDLAPVVRRAASAMGKEAVLVETVDGRAPEVYGSTWILVAEGRVLETTALKGAGRPLSAADGVRLWTDEYSNLLRALK